MPLFSLRLITDYLVDEDPGTLWAAAILRDERYMGTEKIDLIGRRVAIE